MIGQNFYNYKEGKITKDSGFIKQKDACGKFNKSRVENKKKNEESSSVT
jgi:hypothetical protein